MLPGRRVRAPRTGSRLRRHRRPPSRRPPDLPLVTERVDDPTKTPPVLDSDRRSLGCTRTDRPFDKRIWVVDGHEDAASRSSDCAGTETPRALRRRADPERTFAHSELGDDLLAVADAMQDTRPESPLVEVNSRRRTLHPNLRLHAHPPTSCRNLRPQGSFPNADPGDDLLFGFTPADT